jgi:hypothetical protein
MTLVTGLSPLMAAPNRECLVTVVVAFSALCMMMVFTFFPSLRDVSNSMNEPELLE